jgi:4-carboxymuconolactone decarboxylase
LSEEIPDALEELTMPEEIREEFLNLVARVGGEFWGRPGLEPRARSLATLAILCARGQQDELAIHVRLAQENFGVRREEVCELILHCALYAGFPAAVSGFKTAARVFAEMDADSAS